jgi:hypothetical protein
MDSKLKQSTLEKLMQDSMNATFLPTLVFKIKVLNFS